MDIAQRGGVCDIKTGTIVDGSHVTYRSYKCWSNMLRRCYGISTQAKQPCYIGCSVCSEWLIYSDFKSWYDEYYVDGFALDKDLLVKGNKIYSPDTCVFVPQALNNLFNDHAANRGLYPKGVFINKQLGRYQARCGTSSGPKSLGHHVTPEAASKAYQRFKFVYAFVEFSRYRDEYADNAPLMKLLDVLEVRIFSSESEELAPLFDRIGNLKE